MKSKMVGRETKEQESLRLCQNLVESLALMSFCGDAEVMADQLAFQATDLPASDVESGLRKVLLSICDYVIKSHGLDENELDIPPWQTAFNGERIERNRNAYLLKEVATLQDKIRTTTKENEFLKTWIGDIERRAIHGCYGFNCVACDDELLASEPGLPPSWVLSILARHVVDGDNLTGSDAVKTE
jgi:hypothetical protein